MGLLVVQGAPAPIHIPKGVTNSLTGGQLGKEDVMVVAVESSTLKSAPAHYIFSALIKTVSGSSIPESVAELASLITGKCRVHMADSLGAKADHRVADHRKVRVISPHFSSN